MAIYVALLEKDLSSSYGVWFPDFPGCVTGGDTMEEALRRAPEVLRFHVDGMMSAGEKIPVPTSFDRVAANPSHADGIPFVVEVPTERTRPIRLNISLDERLVAAIDARAAASGKTRSAFLAEAARRALNFPI